MFGSKKKKNKAKRLPDDIPYKDAKKIAEDKNLDVRSELAGREDIKPEILYFMAEDKALEVRHKVAANSTTPRHVDFILASDTDDEVRCDLALKIGRPIPGLSKDESERLQDLAFEILNILAPGPIAQGPGDHCRRNQECHQRAKTDDRALDPRC